MKAPKFEVIVGTYEEFLLGFHFVPKQTQLVQTFAIHEHSSSIRCVATSGQYLATGAADDKIIVYDLNQRKEHCMLNHHNATINCLQFTNSHSHLISGSSDGELAIVRVGSWQLEKSWAKAHKGCAVLDIAVHPSGKLALTMGSDCSLRTWNLVKGRQAYIINLNSKSKDAKSLDKIVWAEDGVRFILSGGKYTEIWSIETGGILKVIEHHEKVGSCQWISDDEIIVGYEDGQIAIVEINECTKNIQKAHEGRIKALGKYAKWIVSASSTGEIKVWNKKLEELSKYNTGCRITCLTIAVPSVKVKEEKQEEIVEVVEEQSEQKLRKKSSVVIEIEDEGKYAGYNNKIKRKSNKIKNSAEESEPKKAKKKRFENEQDGQHEQIEAESIKRKKKKKVSITENNLSRTDVSDEHEEISDFVQDKITKKGKDFQKKSRVTRTDEVKIKKKNKKHK